MEPPVEVKETIGAVIDATSLIEPVEVSENVCPAPEAEDALRLITPVLLK